MLKKFFKKQKKDNPDNKNILVISLLIHAAKIDENYTENEKKIIKNVIVDLNEIGSNQADELLKLAEEKERESNQIIENSKKNIFKVNSDMINLIGCSKENFLKLLELMQYKAVKTLFLVFSIIFKKNLSNISTLT